MAERGGEQAQPISQYVPVCLADKMIGYSYTEMVTSGYQTLFQSSTIQRKATARCLPDSPKPDSPKLGFRVRLRVRVRVRVRV